MLNRKAWIFASLVALLLSACADEPPTESSAPLVQSADKALHLPAIDCIFEAGASLQCPARWKRIEPAPTAGYPLNKVWARSTTEVYAVGWQNPFNPHNGTIAIYDGQQWTTDTSGPSVTLFSVRGDDQPAIAGADGTLALGMPGPNANAKNWRVLQAPTTANLNDVLITDPVRQVVVGEDGALFVHTGFGLGPGTWQELETPTLRDLKAIWGTGGAALTVGEAGTILAVRFFDSNVVPMDSGVEVDLNSVWGTGGAAIWGTGGVAIWGTGGTASDTGGRSLAADRIGDLNGIGGADDVTVWGTGGAAIIVGDQGTILEWEDEGWTSVTSGVRANLNGIWGTGGTATDSAAVAVGDNGTLLVRRPGEAWRQGPVLTDQDLTDVWGTSIEDIWVVSDQGEIFHFGLAPGRLQ